MPSGKPLSTPVEWELAEQLGARIKSLREEFAYVLIQAPPATEPATLAFAQAGDGLVLTIEAHTTTKALAMNATRYLKEAGVRLLGAVLTERSHADAR
jgi:Mrp family chromosome partitioning ATPase